MKLNEAFFKDCKFISKDKCWICQKREGSFSKKLKIFRKERLEQKKLGKEAKQLALKILINCGYGVFGHTKFDYYNPMVAELITTYGRYTLTKMQNIAKRLGFEIIYGDTDSLFLNNPPSNNALQKFQDICNKELDIELEIKNRYKKLILSAGKKHYIGFENGKTDIVGMEGSKSDRCEFIREIFGNVVDSIIKYDTNPIPNLTKAISNLESGKVNSNLLKKSIKLGRNLKDYKSQTCQVYKIGKALGARKDELVEYFDSSIRKTGESWSINPADIDVQKYKQALWNTVNEVLKIAGYSVDELANKFGVKIQKKKSNGNENVNKNKKNN